jgi:hypothetical protein
MSRQPHKQDPVGEYLAAARERLAADGNELLEHTFIPGDAIIGYRSSIQVFWKMDLFTVMLRPTRPVTPDVFVEFIRDATMYAESNRRASAWSRTLAVMPIVVTDVVSPALKADALARKPSKVYKGRYNGGPLRWPAVVDVSTGERLYYTGRFWIGRFGSERVWEKLMLAMGPLRVVPRQQS